MDAATSRTEGTRPHVTIPEKDLKKLWGLSAGMCSYPGCGVDLLPFVDEKDPTLVGEMAHVIARKPGGPRGVTVGGDDVYENIILLCPTHHRLVDKAPAKAYPTEVLLEHKRRHEANVRGRLATPRFNSKRELCGHITSLLQESYATWKSFGPESDVARSNPTSNVARLWILRKLDHLIPNNTRIISLLRDHRSLFTVAEYEVCATFMAHATAFEASTYNRLDTVPRFPARFAEMVRNAATE